MVLTPTILSEDQIDVLNKGLNFSPTIHFDLFHTLCDVNRFIRILTVIHHFLTNDLDRSVTLEFMDNGVMTNTPERPIEDTTEFMDLLFEDQLVLSTLQDLARLGLDEDFPEYNPQTRPKFSNPQFYPVKSRVLILDIFQQRVERDLVTLEANSLTSGPIT